ncbi:MAG: hypothetical protein PHC53_00045 [Patescibacteria group bacterium]|nr:hypothetical protein [Patescibacteria group bacterium]
MLTMSFEGPKNPFENLPTEKGQTIKSLMELQDYGRYLASHISQYVISKDEQFELPDRNIAGISQGYGIKENQRSISNTETKMSPSGKDILTYNVASKEGAFLERITQMPFTQPSFTRLAFDVKSAAARFVILDNHLVYGLEDDGLHVKSKQQEAWDKAWSDFMKELCENEKFLKFLDDVGKQEYTSEEEEAKQIRWAKRFKQGTLIIEDVQAFLDEVSGYWSLAVKSQFPKNSIPDLKSFGADPKRPPDDIYGHWTIRSLIEYYKDRLTDTVRMLDSKLPISTEGSPYRSTGRH